MGGGALADSLADVPAREPGAPLSGHSERSQYVKLSRIPEAGPGLRHVDPNDAINSKTPLNKLVGSVTPTDLHYERSHAGVPDLDPAKHRLLIQGMVQKPLLLTVDDLMAMPSVSRIRYELTLRTGCFAFRPDGARFHRGVLFLAGRSISVVTPAVEGSSLRCRIDDQRDHFSSAAQAAHGGLRWAGRSQL
jgi:hypothetical protein